MVKEDLDTLEGPEGGLHVSWLLYCVAEVPIGRCSSGLEGMTVVLARPLNMQKKISCA